MRGRPITRCRPVGMVLIRLRTDGIKGRVWYEYLVRRAEGGYDFPVNDRVPEHIPDGTAVMGLASAAEQRGMVTLPKSYDVLQKCERHVVHVRGCCYHVYYVRVETTQRPRVDRALRPGIQYYWAAGSELVQHVAVGLPSICGLPTHDRAQEVYAALPTKLQFASMDPPVVLYHGTKSDRVPAIVQYGLGPSVEGMLGPGVYVARWDKATSFGAVVFRCVVFLGKTVTMTPDMICTCGCKRPFVDHHIAHGKGFDSSYVPDESLPATRRAEWVVRDPVRVICDGYFTTDAGN